MPLRNALIRLRPMPAQVAVAPAGLLHDWIAAPSMNDAAEGVLHICGICTARGRAPAGMEPDGICPGGG